MSSHLTPEGKSHRVLRLLAEGPAYQWQCADALCVRTVSERRKVFYVLQALYGGGLVEKCFPGWGITDAGRDALDTLNAGQSVWIGAPEPTVRVFARPADNTSCEAA